MRILACFVFILVFSYSKAQDSPKAPNEEAKNEAVKTIVKEMCFSVIKELKCIRKALFKRNKSTYQDDVSQCHKDAVQTSYNIVSRVIETFPLESEQKQFLSTLAQLNMDYELDRRKCQSGEMPFDDMMDCYNTANNDYLKKFKKNFCNSQ